MAKKRRVKVAKRRLLSRAVSSRKSNYTVKPSRSAGSVRRKIKIVITNFLLFVILFVVSVGLYKVSGDVIYINLFAILSIIFGLLSLAFLITFLVLFFYRIFNK